MFVGLDPGQRNGSIVVIDSRTPAGIVYDLSWSHTKRSSGDVYRLWDRVQGDVEVGTESFMRHLRMAFAAMFAGREADVLQLAIEKPLTGKTRGGAAAINVGTIANANLLRGWLEQILNREAIEVGPQDWRKSVLGLRRNLDAGEADEQIKRLIPMLVAMDGLPGPSRQSRTGEHWSSGHRRDALGVALFGRSHV